MIQVVPNREISVVVRFLAAADTLGPCWNGHWVGVGRAANLDETGADCNLVPYVHAHVLSYSTPRALEEIGQEDVTDVSNASNHLPWFITRDYYAQGLSYGENLVNVTITIAPEIPAGGEGKRGRRTGAGGGSEASEERSQVPGVGEDGGQGGWNGGRLGGEEGAGKGSAARELMEGRQAGGMEGRHGEGHRGFAAQMSFHVVFRALTFGMRRAQSHDFADPAAAFDQILVVNLARERARFEGVAALLDSLGLSNYRRCEAWPVS